MNIIILGVGHSGTTILSRMLGELGWDLNDADAGFAESVSARQVNMACVPGPFQNSRQWRASFDSSAARSAIVSLREPWAIKDPRFVFTLDNWAESEAFLSPPLVLYLTKDIDRVRDSYRKRNELLATGEPGMYGHTVAQLAELAAGQFGRWTGPKWQLDYSQLAMVARLFNLRRAA